MRNNITQESVQELVMSIKQVGLIEPIVVKPRDDRYEVIAGHRRKFACEVAKIPQVACYVRYVGTDESEMMKIHENLYREDVKPSDEAKHFDNMIKHYKMSPIKIGQLIGKSESYVHDRLAIFNYPPFLKDAMDAGQISFSVAREFSRIDDVKQINTYVNYAIRSGMTTSTAQKWVQDFKRSKELPGVEQSSIYDAASGAQTLNQSAMCIYCREGVNLLEASVVYMHDQCVMEAQRPIQPQAEPPQP